MSLSDKAHNLRIQLRSIEADMQGISPKTSLYQKLVEKKAAVLFELEQLGAQRTAQSKI